jgi:hypothetical protein
VLAGHGMSLFKADGAVDARLTEKGGDDEGEHICGQAGACLAREDSSRVRIPWVHGVLASGTGCRARAADATNGAL